MKTETSHIDKTSVREFWNSNPCGAKFQNLEWGTPEFYKSVEDHRYQVEPHILEIVPFKKFKGKKVLEIGCGLGTDGAQFARNGAIYSAIDLTPNAISLASRRFDLERLKGDFQVADAEKMPFADGTFDCVYSHGVIHHTPNIESAVKEIHRVLAPGGMAVVMVYHRTSVNYWLNIMVLRKLGLALLLFPGGVWLSHKLTGESLERLRQHRDDFKKMGFKYLSSQIFLSRNTDGAGNPLSRVYTSSGLINLFQDFKNHTTQVHYFNKHRLPLSWLIPKSIETWLATTLGWHIYIFAEK